MTGPTPAGPPRIEPRGVRLGVDVGKVRVGVAISDPDGILATPLATVPRDLSRHHRDIQAIADLVREHGAVEVILGLPVSLSGEESHAAIEARAYGQLLSVALAPVSVVLTDERMSTQLASRRLSERGVRGRRHRAVVDQMAAAEILQRYIDAQRRRTT